MFQICGVFAEFERAMIRERVNAGLARAKAQGKVLGIRSGTNAAATDVPPCLDLYFRRACQQANDLTAHATHPTRGEIT